MIAWRLPLLDIESVLYVACIWSRSTDIGAGVRLTANPVFVCWWVVVCWVKAARVGWRAPVEVTVTFVRVETHLSLAWIQSHLESLDEGLHLCVAMMTPTLSNAEACSNKEQGKSWKWNVPLNFLFPNFCIRLIRKYCLYNNTNKCIPIFMA